MEKNVKINQCEFDPSAIEVNKGNNIFFKSTDYKSYTLSCLSSNSDISDYFPFSVPGDNRKHKLKIKDDAVRNSYDCEIIEGCSDNDKGVVPRPTMIIKVQ